MPLVKLSGFSVNRLSVLDENGNVDEKNAPSLSNSQRVDLFRWMTLLRVFDDKSLKLQRQGRIGTYASCLGQEACTIGSAYAMKPQDWAFPAFREHGVFMVRGTPLAKILQYWGGDERGSKASEDVNMFPVSIPVGSQPLHAVGAAIAFQYKKSDAVAVGYFGDGGSSEGDTLEAMNFAGAFQAPVVFVCQNNQFAISEPRSLQTRAETIAQKAIAFGFDGLQVDGNDILAVYKATHDAIEKARDGKGPTLLELHTYRMGDHTTADDSTRYRNKEELESWRKKDPVARMRMYLTKQGILSQTVENKIIDECVALVERAVQEYEQIPLPHPSDMFDFLYKEMPLDLAEQKNEYLAFLSRHQNTSEKKKEGPGFP
ncbi:MAG: pyruvate dehydrogenase (acetyl-transferring) E1 component subunit alpha [Candidatus Diapherotrites archaeon]